MHVFVARGGVAGLTTTILTEAQVRDLVEQMLKASGRRLDTSPSLVPAQLPGGEAGTRSAKVIRPVAAVVRLRAAGLGVGLGCGG